MLSMLLFLWIKFLSNDLFSPVLELWDGATEPYLGNMLFLVLGREWVERLGNFFLFFAAYEDWLSRGTMRPAAEMGVAGSGIVISGR